MQCQFLASSILLKNKLFVKWLEAAYIFNFCWWGLWQHILSRFVKGTRRIIPTDSSIQNSTGTKECQDCTKFRISYGIFWTFAHSASFSSLSDEMKKGFFSSIFPCLPLKVCALQRAWQEAFGAFICRGHSKKAKLPAMLSNVMIWQRTMNSVLIFCVCGPVSITEHIRI